MKTQDALKALERAIDDLADFAECMRDSHTNSAGEFLPGDSREEVEDLEAVVAQAKQGLEAVKQEIARGNSLPASIQEALNSGDGVYRS